MSNEGTRAAVEGYFGAWTSNRVDDAFAFLAPNLHFAGPSASYETAEAFRPALIGFAKMTKAARVVELLVDGDRAALLYDCDLPPPVNTLRIASFFKVVDGKIAWYETQFDATELSKLLGRKG